MTVFRSQSLLSVCSRSLAVWAVGICLLAISPTRIFAESDEGLVGGFKLGLQSYSLRNFDLPQALAYASSMGIRYVEAYPRHVPISTVPAHLEESKARFSESGVTLLSYGVVHFNANETKAREIFDFAKAVGIQSISADPDPDQETFDLLDRLVEEYQIAIAIHNHGPAHRYSTAEDVLKVVDGRHPLIGACVDTGHYLRSGEDPVEVISKLGKRVHGVHLKDVRTIHSDEEKAKLLQELPANRARQLEKEGKVFTILGEGELNVVGVLRALRAIDYQGIVSLEYEENPENPLSDIHLSLTAAREAVAYLDDSEEGFISLWDGETFNNWKINENPETWKIENGEIIVNGKRSHMFYVGPEAPFRNFELKVDVLAKPNSNSGIYVMTEYQPDGWPAKGFETQVNNTYNVDPRKTGSLYSISDVHEQLIPDNTWWTQHVIVQGNRVIVKVDGKVATDYTEPDDVAEPRCRTGTIALQGHDPNSEVHFRNLRIKVLPE